MSKDVANKACVRGLTAHPSRYLTPQAQVADQRLARHQELVGQHIPRPNDQLTAGHQLAHGIGAFGAHLEIVIEDDGLAIAGEWALQFT